MRRRHTASAGTGIEALHANRGRCTEHNHKTAEINAASYIGRSTQSTIDVSRSSGNLHPGPVERTSLEGANGADQALGAWALGEGRAKGDRYC